MSTKEIYNGDYVMVPTYEIGNAIDWDLKYARDARWDVISKAMEISQGRKKKVAYNMTALDTTLNWNEQTDMEDDNPYYEAQSCYTTDCDPNAVPNIYWRLRQRSQENMIVWYADHDAELGGQTGETWNTIEEAKVAIQKEHDEIIVKELMMQYPKNNE